MTSDCDFLWDVVDESKISVQTDDRTDHAGDWGTPETEYIEPDIVCWPESTTDVSAILAAANDRGVPVTPYAAGSGIEGSAVPVCGGISMDLTEMSNILDIRPDDFQIDIEPGVHGKTLNDTVAKYDLFLPPLPQSSDISTMGGMLATDASGAKTVKYGEVHDWILELEAVLADGSVIEVGSKAKKTSSGYNLKDIIVGSEGTLAVITRATFELKHRPTQIQGGRVIFEKLEHATAAITEIMQAGLDVATVELLDRLSTDIANTYSGTDLPNMPTIFLEFHTNNGIDAEIEICRKILNKFNANEANFASGSEMDELWSARRNLADAILAYDPPRRPAKPGDIAVPISEYSNVIRYIKGLEKKHGIEIPCFGHAGDGNIHYDALVDPNDDEELETGKMISDAVVERAIEMGGTATGEHGVGQGKRGYMIPEHGEETVETMKSIRDAFDPNNILNPYKIFP